VSRRLELLTTELAGVREATASDDVRPQRARIRAVPDLARSTHARADDGLGAAYEEEGEEALDDVAGPGRGAGPATSVARLPGRHASRRRSGAAWSDVVPDGLRGRVAFGSGQVAVVAILVAVGLALTCWWLVRSGGHTLPAPTALETPQDPRADLTAPVEPAGSSGGGGLTATSSSGTAAPAKIVVDVTGKVRHPGIAVLRSGARIVDALRAVGGARPGVDLAGLNLAQVLTDGELVVVGGPAPAAAGSAADTAAGAAAGTTSGSAGGSAAGAGVPVDINTADETTLESLPEVGPVTAAAIIAWRGQHGGFTSVNQLLDVDGIGDATLAKLAPLVTI
jgi:competence protein ComEA